MVLLCLYGLFDEHTNMCTPWKLAIALGVSYAKFQRGLSDKPIHESFGSQVDLLLGTANDVVDRGDVI